MKEDILENVLGAFIHVLSNVIKILSSSKCVSQKKEMQGLNNMWANKWRHKYNVWVYTVQKLGVKFFFIFIIIIH